jgi:hypothetical protein
MGIVAEEDGVGWSGIERIFSADRFEWNEHAVIQERKVKDSAR